MFPEPQRASGPLCVAMANGHVASSPGSHVPATGFAGVETGGARANPEERSAQPADAASREQNSLLSFGGSFCYTVKPDTNITPDSGHVFFSL